MALLLRDVRTADLAPIGHCRRVEHLQILFAPRLVDLSFLATLPALRSVCLGETKRVDLETLPTPRRLTSFTLVGSYSTTLTVPSFDPLSRLQTLEYLSLCAVRPAEGSLRPLAALQKLKELVLSDIFEVDEFARLSASLPRTKGKCLTPIYMDPAMVCTRCVRRMCCSQESPRFMCAERVTLCA